MPETLGALSAPYPRRTRTRKSRTWPRQVRDKSTEVVASRRPDPSCNVCDEIQDLHDILFAVVQDLSPTQARTRTYQSVGRHARD